MPPAARPTPPELLVWDLDGTLVDSGHHVPQAFVRTVAAVGGHVVSPADVEAAYPLGPPERMLAHLLRRPATEEDLSAYYTHLGATGVVAYPGVPGVLRAQRAYGPVAVCTGASRRAAAVLLHDAGLADLVDVLVCAEDARRAKPAPDGLLVVAARLGVPPGALAMVGDSARDLMAAGNAGALAVAAGWGHEYDPAVPADVTIRSPAAALALLGPAATTGRTG
ncbi:HAD family hydrolase [Micromonospora rosaria]|uniref:HAD family hydrolase n=1 Tax=Micromonospora rosaria TaxID=47874 RepID=UPI00083403D6|nr:HAD family hydrolase [Micromonospora rosaria]